MYMHFELLYQDWRNWIKYAHVHTHTHTAIDVHDLSAANIAFVCTRLHMRPSTSFIAIVDVKSH